MRHVLMGWRRARLACAIAADAQGGTARHALTRHPLDRRARRRAGAGNPPAGGPVLEIHTGRGAVRRPVTAAVGLQPLAEPVRGCPRPVAVHQVQLRMGISSGSSFGGIGRRRSPGPVAHGLSPCRCGVVGVGGVVTRSSCARFVSLSVWGGWGWWCCHQVQLRTVHLLVGAGCGQPCSPAVSPGPVAHVGTPSAARERTVVSKFVAARPVGTWRTAGCHRPVTASRPRPRPAC
jgi:hypothetical protein